jgi:hypothetical protein
MRRPWSEEDIAKLRSMARRYPTQRIAAELGRGVSATRVKAHHLRLSLNVRSKATKQQRKQQSGTTKDGDRSRRVEINGKCSFAAGAK